jgi:hypothetical protein
MDSSGSHGSVQTSDIAGHSAGSAGQNTGTTHRSRMHYTGSKIHIVRTVDVYRY